MENAIVASSSCNPSTNTHTMIVQISRSFPQLLLNIKYDWTKKRKRKDNTYTLRFDELVTTSRLTAACNNSRYSRTNYALYCFTPTAYKSAAQTSITLSNLIFYHDRLRQSRNNISIQKTKYYEYFF